MKVFDKKIITAIGSTFLVLVCVLAFNAKTSYALPDLAVPEITSFKASDLEKNALKLLK